MRRGTWLTQSRMDIQSWKDGAEGLSSLLKTCKKSPMTSCECTEPLGGSFTLKTFPHVLMYCKAVFHSGHICLQTPHDRICHKEPGYSLQGHRGLYVEEYACIADLKRFAAERRFWCMHPQHMAKTQGVPQLHILQRSRLWVTCCQEYDIALLTVQRSFLRSVYQRETRQALMHTLSLCASTSVLTRILVNSSIALRCSSHPCVLCSSNLPVRCSTKHPLRRNKCQGAQVARSGEHPILTAY